MLKKPHASPSTRIPTEKGSGVEKVRPHVLATRIPWSHVLRPIPQVPVSLLVTALFIAMEEKKCSSGEKQGLSRMENVGTFTILLEVFFFSRFNQNDQKIYLPHAFLTLFPFSLMKHAVVSVEN